MNDVKTGKLIPYLSEMFRYQAWIALGKVANPVSGKVDRDLNVAREMIDLLAELETRTEGNRSGDETKLLQGILTELRLNYVDEAKKPEKPQEAEKPAQETGESPVEAGGEPRAEETRDGSAES